MKPETQLKHVVAGIEKLASFLAKYTPSCGRIHIRRADWLLLRKQPDLARAYGFVVSEEHVRYRDYDLQPTDCGAHYSSSDK